MPIELQVVVMLIVVLGSVAVGLAIANYFKG